MLCSVNLSEAGENDKNNWWGRAMGGVCYNMFENLFEKNMFENYVRKICLYIWNGFFLYIV